ncbi:MAG: hypothetical protein ABSB70_18220 [Candidatus Velthaea sp.]|jgi:hypothetical protein
MNKFFFATLTAVCLALPIAAQAQDVPSYAAQQYSDDQNIHGRVLSFDGDYGLSVRDEQGYVDNVELHPGTIINPIGLTLAPGMVVSILGYNAGSYFAANEVDTPYQFSNAVPYYGGHPWDYYGPSISLSFFFGNAGWWHGGSFNGGYRYAGGARVYNNVNVHVSDVYRGTPGQFHGRNYVAPAEHGGYYSRASREPSAHQNNRDNRDDRGGDHAR